MVRKKREGEMPSFFVPTEVEVAGAIITVQ